MNPALLPILAAEDEESDRFILSLAFERAELANPLITVNDGQEAVDYLAGGAPFGDRVVYPLPALLILDVKMPRMSGFDVLAWLATRSEFKDLPAVMLSSSADDSDIRQAQEKGARDYFVKPHSLSDFVKLLQTLQRRWLAGLPPR
jgi:CheY-like chemotaxis protein